MVGEVGGDAPAGPGHGDGRGGRVDALEGRVDLVAPRHEARVRVAEGHERGEAGAGRSLSLSIITRVAPHCVNTLRILHAAYDATNTTCPLVNTYSVR